MSTTEYHYKGAWAGILTDWLDRENLTAPEIRAMLSSYSHNSSMPQLIWQQALEQAAALSTDPLAFGIRLGMNYHPRHSGLIGYLTASCQTPGEALTMFKRYIRLFYDPPHVAASFVGSDVEILWEPTNHSKLSDEVAIAAAVSWLKRYVKPGDHAFIHLSFRHHQNGAEAEIYKRLLGCQIHFAESRMRVLYPQKLLSMPLPSSDIFLRDLLVEQANADIVALPPATNFYNTVRSALLEVLHDEATSAQHLASSLGVSLRTFYRRLRDEGITWQELLDRTREELAKQQLQESKLTIKDISIRLGFTDQTAFSKAFQRWTGRTPRQFRVLAKEVKR